LNYTAVKTLAPGPHAVQPAVARQVEIEIKYEGYIRKQLKEIDRFKNLERLRIPQDFDFGNIHGLSNELKEKLSAVRPDSLGQASRIDGITPAAISVLMVAVKSSGKIGGS
jgi:tRNA uridine 5-carboxymethylaminomethyl modification enzyme